MPLIPAWAVSLLALMAALSLSRVRVMPLYIRISITVPLIYFSLIYAWASFLDSGIVQVDIVRAGMILIFLPIIVNSIIVRYESRRGKL